MQMGTKALLVYARIWRQAQDSKAQLNGEPHKAKNKWKQSYHHSRKKFVSLLYLPSFFYFLFIWCWFFGGSMSLYPIHGLNFIL